MKGPFHESCFYRRILTCHVQAGMSISRTNTSSAASSSTTTKPERILISLAHSPVCISTLEGLFTVQNICRPPNPFSVHRPRSQALTPRAFHSSTGSSPGSSGWSGYAYFLDALRYLDEAVWHLPCPYRRGQHATVVSTGYDPPLDGAPVIDLLDMLDGDGVGLDASLLHVGERCSRGYVNRDLDSDTASASQSRPQLAREH